MSKRELTFLLNALDQAGVKFGDPSQWGQALGEKTRKQFSSWWDMFIGRMTHERNRTPYPAPIPHEKSIPAKPSTR
ncbi:hypothetical protein [Eel River basin pequenovirus]|nr:hypothetical protein [Eel River basin pequenovirus]